MIGRWNDSDSTGSTRTSRLPWLLLSILSALGGCYQKIEKPALEVIRAELTTPEGSYPLHLRTPVGCRVFPLTFIGGSERVGVEISILHPCARLVLGPLSSNGEYVVATESTYTVLEGSYYQRNAEPQIPLRFGTPPGQQLLRVFELEVPEPLGDLLLLSAGGELIPNIVPLVRERENDVHRVHVAFLADGLPHAIDIAFRLGIDDSWLASPPGVVP